MAEGQGGGTYHYAGTPATSWACFARDTFALAGRAVTVTDIPSADYPTPAARPMNSRMDCRELETDFGIKQPDWKAALAEVIHEVSA
jgi:dTDP-4-dehydrorhamnose reductase